jgi:hypothetical protein
MPRSGHIRLFRPGVAGRNEDGSLTAATLTAALTAGSRRRTDSSLTEAQEAHGRRRPWDAETPAAVAGANRTEPIGPTSAATAS